MSPPRRRMRIGIRMRNRRPASQLQWALEQRVPGMLVEAALGPSVPPVVVVERDAPDEVPPAAARRLPASGQGLEG